MLVATFATSTGWAGRQITYEEGRFALQDHGVIPLEGVLDYDRLGQLDWVSGEMRSWVFSLAQWAGVAVPQGAPGQPAGQSYVPAYRLQTTEQQYQPPHSGTGYAASPASTGYPPPQAGTGYPPPQAGTGYGPQQQAAPGTHGLPAWAIVLIVVVALLFVGGTLAAVLIPMELASHIGEQTDEMITKENLRTIQVAIDAYAKEMNGSYPATVDPATMGRYISYWPVNPYTNVPMVDSVSAGNFSYLPGSGGRSYQLVGYGADGEVIMTLGSGGLPTI